MMTIMGITLSTTIIWLILAVIFGIIEALTLGLTTIWFAGGAILASICAMLGAPLPVQIAAFFVASILLLYFTKPLIKKQLKVGKEKTNTDALIGQEAIVITAIPPLESGQVKLNGLVWTAVSEDRHDSIKEGTTVIINRIEGVKVIVSPTREEIIS